MKRWYWTGLGGFVAMGLVVAGAMVLLAPKPVVPDEIRRQLGMTVLVPQSRTMIVDPTSMQYDAHNRLLTYSVATFGTLLAVNEQEAPAQLKDRPAELTAMLQSMNVYHEMDSAYGIIHLARPSTGQRGGGNQANHDPQVAVLNANGLLLYIRTVQDLTDEQWKQFVKSFRPLSPAE